MKSLGIRGRQVEGVEVEEDEEDPGGPVRPTDRDLWELLLGLLLTLWLLAIVSRVSAAVCLW